MRIINAIFFGSIAALSILTAPVLARTSDAQKTDDKSTSSSCDSFKQNPDGSWTQVPCQEIGPAAQTPRKPSTRSVDDTTH